MTLLCCLALLSSLSLHAQDGTLDATFDPGTGPTYLGRPIVIDSVAFQKDGKMIVTGIMDSFNGVPCRHVVRLNTDGSVDPSFVADPGDDAGEAYAATVLPDDKILINQTVNSGGLFSDNFVRLNPDGSRDRGFAYGIEIGAFGRPLVLADGKLVQGGPTEDEGAVVRLNPDGSADPDFSAVFFNDSVYDLALQPDGKILVRGFFHDRIADQLINGLERLNPDGSVDQNFVAPFDYHGLESGPVLVQPDGKIVLSGDSLYEDGDDRLLGVVRLNADGSVDPSFTSDYKVNGGAFDLILQADGKIVTTGYNQVRRLNTDGSVDAGFNVTLSRAGFESSENGLYVRRQDDGKLVIVGPFSQVDGVPRACIARLNNTAPAVPPPQITGPASPGGTAGSPLTFQITATNAPLSYGVNTLLLGLTIDPLTGVVSGTPAVPGVYALIATATNAAGTGQAPFTLNVAAAPGVAAPVITSAGGAYGQYNDFYLSYHEFTYQIKATNTPVLFTAIGLPDGVMLDARTGFISGYPHETGTFNVTLSASNAGGTATAALSVIVTTDTPPIPVLTSATAVSGQVGQPFSYQSTATNYPTGYNVTGLPDGLNLDHTTGLISGTPTTTGTYQTLLYIFNSSDPRDPFALNITVAAASVLAPVITSATSASGQAGAAFTYQITGSNGPTSFAATRLPAGLSLDPIAGVVSGVPSVAGSFSVGLSATNAAGTGTATLVLTVRADPTVLAPVITSAASASGVVGQAFSYQITATHAPASYAASGLPAGLGLDTTSGLLGGTARAVGTFTLTLSASNAGGTGTATLTLSVTADPSVPAPAVTSALVAAAQAGEPFAYQITASHAPTSFAATRLPGGLSVDPASGVISGTPTTAGSFAVTLSATNAGGTGTATLSLTVAPALPVVSLLATTPTVTAGSGDLGVCTLSLSAAQDHDVFVSFTIKGTAVNGSDYVLLKDTKKIKAGKTSKPVKVVPLGAGAGPGVKRTVVLTLAPGTGYTVGTTGKVKLKILGQ